MFFLKREALGWLLFSRYEMIVGRCYVKHAAIWHWYLPFLSIPLFFFCFVCLLIVSINQTKGSTIAACSSQGWHLTDHFFRKFMSDACAYACFVLYIYVETNFADF